MNDIESDLETKLRDAKLPEINTEAELAAYIKSLMVLSHSYDSCVYAMSLAAQAAFNYALYKLMATGFQSSCAAMHFISKTQQIDGPFCLLQAYDMLYPQYDLHKKLDAYMNRWQEWCAEEAKKKLLSPTWACPKVVAHWQMRAAYVAPPK